MTNDELIFTVPLGNEVLRINQDTLTVEKVGLLKASLRSAIKEHEKELADKQKQLEALAQKYNDLSKEIAESTEITEEERTAKFAELVINRTKEAESIFPEDSETYVMSVVFLTLKALADLDGQGHKVTKANFAKCPYVKTKLMLAKLLIQNEISEVGIIFLPPKNLD